MEKIGQPKNSEGQRKEQTMLSLSYILKLLQQYIHVFNCSLILFNYYEFEFVQELGIRHTKSFINQLYSSISFLLHTSHNISISKLYTKNPTISCYLL